MKVRQAIVPCPQCGKQFSVLEYTQTNKNAWALYSDGYLYYPNNAAPWHRFKICPYCESSVEITGELETIEVIRGPDVVLQVACEGDRRCTFAHPFPDLQAGEFLYIRAIQRDGGAAWSSPFFFVDP